MKETQLTRHNDLGSQYTNRVIKGKEGLRM